MKVLLGYAFKAAVLALAAHFGSLFADNIRELRRLEALHTCAHTEVTKLRRRERALLAEAQALRHDPFYVELTMRRKLRWVTTDQRRPCVRAVVCQAAPRQDQTGADTDDNSLAHAYSLAYAGGGARTTPRR